MINRVHRPEDSRLQRPHNELPPVAFRINIPVAAMRVSRSNPYRMGAWRLFPPAGLPVITASFIAVVSAYPNVIPAWTGSAVFMDADWRTKFYDDLGLCRTKAQCSPDECVKKDFHCSPDYLQAGRWPMPATHRSFNITLISQSAGPKVSACAPAKAKEYESWLFARYEQIQTILTERSLSAREPMSLGR